MEVKNSVTNQLEYHHSLNEKYLQQLYGEDWEYAAEMFDIFVDTAKEAIAGIREGVIQGNRKEIGSWVHKLRPCYAMVGLDELYRLANQIEERGIDNFPIQERLAVIHQLITETHSSLYIIHSESDRLRSLISE